ncbi:MAG: ATP-binding protein [Bacteroidales bacterium]|nr:ATP-binding protein [Bacteroidales bacterium]
MFPFVVDDQYLDIDTREKTRFSLYYFQHPNSFLIYEIINNLNIPYCILINRTGQALNFHFISAPFDMDWLYNGDDQVTSWQEIRQKLSELGINCKTEDRMWKFNNIFLGKGEYYDEQYSIVRTPKDRDAIRPLISAIFKNRPFTQENLKETLVAAVMSSNQVDTEGIELASHKSNLESFTQRYADIKKMTVKDKNGHTAISPIADDLFLKVDRYYTNQEERKLIPGLLKYAVEKASTRKAELESLLTTKTKERSSAKTAWEESDKAFQEKLDQINEKRGAIKHALDSIKEIEDKYKDVDIEALVDWIAHKKEHAADKASLDKRYADLTSDSKDIVEEMKKALEGHKLLYQHKQTEEEKRHNRAISAIQNSIGEITKKASDARRKVDEKYKELQGGDWKTTELNLIDALINIASKLASAETVEEVRSSLNEDSFPGLNTILDGILSRREIERIPIPDLQDRVNKARKAIENELDRKLLLESQRTAELKAIDDNESKELEPLKQKKKDENEYFNENIPNIVKEHNDKATEIKEDYEARIHGNDEGLKATIEELKSNIESEEYILQCIENFPSAAEDKERYLDKKAETVKERDSLNLDYTAVFDKKKTAKSTFEENDGKLKDDLESYKAEKDRIEGNLNAANSFLERKSDFRAAYDVAEPIPTEQTAKDIITSYDDIRRTIDDLKEEIPETVKRIYAPDMLSRVDTFQLGISRNDSLSTFDEFLSVAEKLRTRLENSDEKMGLDWYVRLNTNIWLDEIRNISTAMSPVENMLMQIQKLCRKATDFVKEYNKTDCIDDFSMNVNEKDTTDLVRILREISKFYQEKNVVLGFDNLFSDDEEPANKKAIELLERFSDELERCGEQRISMTSMFDIRMNVTEKGNTIKNVLSLNRPGSSGTASVLKAMLNMTLLHIFLEKNQAENTKLICAIDEMNTISAYNLDVLTRFADAAGMIMIGSGQDHTKAVLDYAYNVYDITQADGSRIKEISLDATRLKENDEVFN